jgi:heme exporter protein C
MKRVFPILAVLTAALLSYALYEALVVAPTEQTMGDVQRIFYYHVPSAWTAFVLLLPSCTSFAVLTKRTLLPW